MAGDPMKYLLDTNIVSAPFKPAPPPGLMRRLERESERCAISSLTWHELTFGCALLPPSRKRSALEGFLREVVLPTYPILPFGRPEAEWHAQERARLRSKGQPAPFVDGQIAAVAAVKGLVLVTLNLSDFEVWKDLELEDWRETQGSS